jgi:hypothetical protein
MLILNHELTGARNHVLDYFAPLQRHTDKVLFSVPDWTNMTKPEGYYSGEALLSDKSYTLIFVKEMLAELGYVNTPPSQILDLSEVSERFFI